MPEPVLYVPGYPACHLHDGDGTRFFLNAGTVLSGGSSALLEGPDDLSAAGDDGVRAGEPIRRVALLVIDLEKYAATLYRVLDRLGVTELVPFGWDWRRPVWDDEHDWTVQQRLEVAIRDLRLRSGRPVTVIAHSTGGLIVRRLFEAQPEVLGDVRRLISFGVPWAGLLRSLTYLVGGQDFGPTISARRTLEILARSWAAFDLIPSDPTHMPGLNLAYRQQGGVRVPVDLLAERGWLEAFPEGLRGAADLRAREAAERLADRRPRIDTGGRELEVVNVVGWGHPTQIAAQVTGTGSAMRVTVEPPTSNDPEMDGGDGTAPRRSVAWLEGGNGVDVTTVHLPIGVLGNSRTRTHTELWLNPGGENLLAHHLAGEPLAPFTHLALGREALQSDGPPDITVRAVALDTAGRPLPDARLELRDLTPGGPIVYQFNPAFEGRGLLTVPRARIRRRQGNAKVRTLTVRFVWNGGQSRETFSFKESP